MSAGVATLRDDFSDNLVAAAWNTTASGSATVAETGGQMRATLPSSVAGTHTARYTSRATYSLAGDWFVVNIGTMVSTSVAATAFYQLYKDGSNTLQWVQVSGTLYARTIIGGVSTDRYTAAWSGTTYKYLAIAEGSGTITFWSSVNGTSWTSRFSMANPFPVTDLYIDFGATCGNVASPGSFRLEDVNLILPALTTTWRWIQVRWPLDKRGKTVTTATAAANTIQGYVVTADGVDASDAPSGNIRYWSGPMDGGRVLTEQLTQAAAQAMAVNIPLDGRIDLPEMVEGRCTRVYFRSITGSTVTWRELYPRRLIQTDDLEAEIIRGMTILGHQLVVDQLSALTADVGTLTGGVIDGVTIYAGGHNVTLDSSGVSILENASGSIIPNAVTWYEGPDPVAYITTAKLSTVHTLYMVGGDATTVRTGRANIQALGKTGFTDTARDATLDLIGSSSVGVVSSATLSAHIISLNGADGVNVVNGLNIGSATGAAAGQLAMSGVLAIKGAPINAAISLNVKGTGATNATAAIKVVNSASAVNFQALDDGTITTRKGNRWDIGAYVGGGTLTATGLTAVTIDGTAHFFLSR